MILAAEGLVLVGGKKIRHTVILSTTNPTWSVLGWNPGLRSERPANNYVINKSVGQSRRHKWAADKLVWSRSAAKPENMFLCRRQNIQGEHKIFP